MRGQRGPGGAKDFRKPKDTKGTLLRLLNYVVANKALLIAVLVTLPWRIWGRAISSSP